MILSSPLLPPALILSLLKNSMAVYSLMSNALTMPTLLVILLFQMSTLLKRTISPLDVLHAHFLLLQDNKLSLLSPTMVVDAGVGVVIVAPSITLPLFDQLAKSVSNLVTQLLSVTIDLTMPIKLNLPFPLFIKLLLLLHLM
jgi:hypothetical protein